LVRKIRKKIVPVSVIVSSDTKSLKTVKINPWVLKFSAVLGTVSICLLIFLLFSYVNFQFKLKENEKLAYENKVQAEKLVALKRNLNELSDELKYVDGIKENIDEMVESSRVSLSTTTPSRSNSNKSQISSASIYEDEANNDNNNSTSYPNIDTSKKGLIALEELEGSIDLLIEEVAKEKIQIEELEESVGKRLDFLAAEPTFWPVKGRITSIPGERANPFTGRGSENHGGLDIAAPYGTYVRAAGDGVVTFVGYDSVYGRMVVVDHGYSYKSMYGHNSTITVKVGEKVERGEVIARIGSTGRSTGPHLDFRIFVNGDLINPLDILE